MGQIHSWIAVIMLTFGAAQTPATLAQSMPAPLRVGVLTDMSGVYSEASGAGSVEAARMAAEEIGGTVGGRRIEILSADCQNKPDIGVAIARRWYDQEDVSVLAEGCNSAVALAVQQLTRDRNRIALWSGPGSSALTGRACSPNGVQWTYDTYALANALAKDVVGHGGKTWFFITADYAFGQALEADATAVVLAAGGRVVGSVKHPLGATDFSSYLLQAKASGADVVALANASVDTATAVKQAAEFGVGGDKQRLTALLMLITDVRAVGLEAAQGLLLAESFYWNRDEESRVFGRRFFAKVGRMPTMMQAGVYSAVQHYLKSVAAAGTDEAGTVLATMRRTPVQNAVTRNGTIRPDGRMSAEMLVLRVKAPSASTEAWDTFDVVRVIPGEQAYRTMAEGGCSLTP